MSLTTRKLKEVESKAAKLDIEIEVAIKKLEPRLQSNRNSNSLSCMPCPNHAVLPTPPPLAIWLNLGFFRSRPKKTGFVLFRDIQAK